MSNQIDNPKALPLAGFRRLAGDLHSVAKQAPFRVAFRVNFGSENRPKINEISSFGALRFVSAFWAGRSAQNPKICLEISMQSPNASSSIAFCETCDDD